MSRPRPKRRASPIEFEEGYPPSIFVNGAAAEAHTCTICLNVCRNAYFSGCDDQHEFCKSCITEYFRSQGNRHKKCPNCNGRTRGCAPAPVIDRLISGEQVKCTLPDQPIQQGGDGEEGAVLPQKCDWRGELSGLAAHIANRCGFVVMQCDDCHLSNIYRRDFDGHENICPMAIEKCPLGCGKEFLRKEMDKHFTKCWQRQNAAKKVSPDHCIDVKKSVKKKKDKLSSDSSGDDRSDDDDDDDHCSRSKGVGSRGGKKVRYQKGSLSFREKFSNISRGRKRNFIVFSLLHLIVIVFWCIGLFAINWEYFTFAFILQFIISIWLLIRDKWCNRMGYVEALKQPTCIKHCIEAPCTTAQAWFYLIWTLIAFISGYVYLVTHTKAEGGMRAVIVAMAFGFVQGFITIFNSGGHCCVPSQYVAVMHPHNYKEKSFTPSSSQIVRDSP